MSLFDERRLAEYRDATAKDRTPCIGFVRRTCQKCRQPSHPAGGRVINKKFYCRGCKPVG